jgi:hypothetical protein
MGTTATHSLTVGEGITKFVESSAANSDTVISAPAKKHQSIKYDHNQNHHYIYLQMLLHCNLPLQMRELLRS